MSAFAVRTYLGKAQRRPVPTIAYLYDPLFSYIANKAANEGCQRGILLVTPVTAQVESRLNDKPGAMFLNLYHKVYQETTDMAA